MFPIAQNLQDTSGIQQVQAAMDTAIAGRQGQAQGQVQGAIMLVAVSKTRPAGDIRRAFAAGLRHFGENYVQEAVDKIHALADLRATRGIDGIQWHLIGPLQSNKARLAATHFDWVQSVDREKIADALNQHRPITVAPLNVLIQVNISAETAKSGAAPASVAALAAHIATLPRLKLRGLMAIAENITDETLLRGQFRQMHRLFAQTKLNHPQLDTLSMGMSQDYTIAIDEGATMVRVGSAIFGARVAADWIQQNREPQMDADKSRR